MSKTRVPNALIANPAVSIISAPSVSGPMTISTNALCSGTLNVSGFSSLAGIQNSSSLTQSGAISFTPDNTFDIGQNATTARPRDLWLGRNATVGGTLTTASLGVGSGNVVRAPANAATSMSVESPSGNLLLSGAGSVQSVYNGYWDGTNWQRFATANPYYAWWVGNAGLSWFYAAAGANPVTGMAAIWSLTHTSGPNGTVAMRIGAAGSVNYIRTPINSVNALSIESQSQYLMLCSASGTHVGFNTYWDGTAWQIMNAGNYANIFVASNNSFVWYGATSPNTVSWGQAMSLSNGGTLTVAQGITTSAGDITAGSSQNYSMWATAFRFGASGASYYWALSSGNYIRSVGCHIMSDGNYCFNANTGIYVGGWDGTWLHTSHSLMLNGNSIGFGNNGGVNWTWNGGQLVSTHSIVNSGNYYYFANTSFALYTDGSWVRATGGSGFGTSGNYLWMANNSGVGLYWDGTWCNVQPRMWAVNEASADVVIVRNQSSGLRFTDDNVRSVRPGSTNQLKTYIYDAWEQWHRTWDGASMGYIDINGFHNGSTIKNKHNLRDFRDGLSLLKDSRIKPRRYTMTDVPRGKGRRRGPPGERPEELIEAEHVGFIAEEMVEVIPEVVGLDPETGEPVGINYGALVPILWDAVRRLSERLDKLEGAAA